MGSDDEFENNEFIDISSQKIPEDSFNKNNSGSLTRSNFENKNNKLNSVIL